MSYVGGSTCVADAHDRDGLRQTVSGRFFKHPFVRAESWFTQAIGESVDKAKEISDFLLDLVPLPAGF